MEETEGEVEDSEEEEDSEETEAEAEDSEVEEDSEEIEAEEVEEEELHSTLTEEAFFHFLEKEVRCYEVLRLDLEGKYIILKQGGN